MNDDQADTAPADEPLGSEADDGSSVTARMLDELRSLDARVTTLTETLDQLVPHLVSSLKRNQALESILERLDSAEKRLAARQEAPIASVLLRTMNEVLHMKELDAEARTVVVKGVASSLRRSGYDLIVPDPGSPYDHETSEITAADPGASIGPAPVVADLDSAGLACLGTTIIKAKVTLASESAAHPNGAPA